MRDKLRVIWLRFLVRTFWVRVYVAGVIGYLFGIALRTTAGYLARKASAESDDPMVWVPCGFLWGVAYALAVRYAFTEWPPNVVGKQIKAAKAACLKKSAHEKTPGPDRSQ